MRKRKKTIFREDGLWGEKGGKSLVKGIPMVKDRIPLFMERSGWQTNKGQLDWDKVKEDIKLKRKAD